MRIGFIILNGFAALWGYLGLRTLGAPAWACLVPAGLSALLVAALYRRVPSGDRSPGDRRRVRRVVGLATTGEVVAILVAVNLCAWAGRPRLAIPAVAAIVGLHFLPLARWLPARVYYVTGAALTLLALGSLAVAEPARDVAVGLGACAILWATAVHIAMRRPVRAGPAPV